MWRTMAILMLAMLLTACSGGGNVWRSCTVEFTTNDIVTDASGWLKINPDHIERMECRDVTEAHEEAQ